VSSYSSRNAAFFWSILFVQSQTVSKRQFESMRGVVCILWSTCLTLGTIQSLR